MSQTVPTGTVAAPADPRPRLLPHGDAAVVCGVRCTRCGLPMAFARPRCPACHGPVQAAEFGPEGTVWSATMVRIPVPGRKPPYGLAYVDLDDGPRVLAHLTGTEVPDIGTRVRLTWAPLDPDLRVEVV